MLGRTTQGSRSRHSSKGCMRKLQVCFSSLLYKDGSYKLLPGATKYSVRTIGHVVGVFEEDMYVSTVHVNVRKRDRDRNATFAERRNRRLRQWQQLLHPLRLHPHRLMATTIQENTSKVPYRKLSHNLHIYNSKTTNDTLSNTLHHRQE